MGGARPQALLFLSSCYIVAGNCQAVILSQVIRCDILRDVYIAS